MKRKILLGTFFLFLFLISATVSYFIGIYKRIYVGSKTIKSDISASEITSTPTPTPDPLGPKNILVLGYGGPGHDGGLLTDTMIVLHVVPRKRSVTLISIPRDILVTLPVTKEKKANLKVNHAYAIGIDHKNYPDKPDKYMNAAGGGNMSKFAVNIITGLPIDHFVSVNFDGFKNIVDSLGGIEIAVPYTFEDKFYPIKGLEDDSCGKSEEDIGNLTATMSGFLLEQEFPCRYETLHFEKGLQLMDGTTTLKFVRSRHSNNYGSDFGRAIRQQAFIVGLKNKLLKFNSLTRAVPVINTISKNVTTDIDITQALDLVKNQDLYSDVAIQTVSLSIDNVLEESMSADRQYVLLPKGGSENWQVIHNYIKEGLKD